MPLKSIRQLVVEVTDRTKQQALISMIEMYRPYLAIIFCRTKRRASALNAALLEQGYESDELHGDLSQAKREQVMKRFREAKLQLLVATDVAARGLDVEGVTHVFNYDMPHEVDSYIHRIGRTGRAGGKGMAITLASPKDKGDLQRIEQGIQYTIERRRYEKDGAIVEARGPRPAEGRAPGRRKEQEGGRGGTAGSSRGGQSRSRREDKAGPGFLPQGGRPRRCQARSPGRRQTGSRRIPGAGPERPRRRFRTPGRKSGTLTSTDS